MSTPEAKPADHYAVMGYPIAHSRSPRIHALFAQQTGAAMDYRAIAVTPDAFSQAVTDFRNGGGKGLNITVPFKQEAWALATRRSEHAERAGAVNTLTLHDDGSVQGDNTDGVGLLRDLVRNHGITLAKRRVLVLGAGGAARGILEPLLEQQPSLLLIANRTADKAVQLARDFCDLGRTEACGFADLAGHTFDIVIHATAAGLTDDMPPLPAGLITADGWCYDLMYGDTPTPFLRWAKAQGAAHTVDGLGMLVEQAAESFFIWRGVRPDTGPVIRALRSAG